MKLTDEQSREAARRFGAKGAAKRNANLTPEQKSEIARNAALVRWAAARKEAK